MPSLIGSIGPDGTVNTGVAANYRRQQLPYSRFGTRKVIWFTIGMITTRLGDGSMDNTNLNTLIDAIQTRAEIAIIGAPRLGENYGRITIGIFEDTFNNGDDTDPSGYYTNAKATTLQDVIKEALGDSSVDVTEVYLFGGVGSGGDTGWSTSSEYQEYTTKGEYVAQSYLNPNDL